MDHILSVYGLGGSPEAIEETYLSHDYLEPVKPGPERITDANFSQHLGDDKWVALSVHSAASILTRLLL